MNSPPKDTGKNQTKMKRYKKRTGSLSRKRKSKDKNIKRPSAPPIGEIPTGPEIDSQYNKRNRDVDEAETIGGACEKKTAEM